jgi:adenylate kinase family enzyme
MKYEKEFPIFKTKVAGVDTTFDLSTPEGRKEYFEAKAGKEIAQLKEFFKDNSFVAYLLAKKSAGKGTYTKLIREIFGADVIEHVSVGDTVRDAHKAAQADASAFTEALRPFYRGYISLEEGVETLLGKSQDKLLPSEFVLALVKQKIHALPRKTIFLDGFPRELDQISYTLFLRELIDYRDDPDLFIAIDIPEVVIDERMKTRVVCPVCQTPRNTKLLTTRDVEYDEASGEFFLLCDDHHVRMIPKEGDAAGIASIKDRLKKDGELIEKLFTLHGIPKLLIRNAIPVSVAHDYVDDYELTPMYTYSYENGVVVTHEEPWSVKDDEGIEVHSLLAPPAVLALIKQLPHALGLGS